MFFKARSSVFAYQFYQMLWSPLPLAGHTKEKFPLSFQFIEFPHGAF